LWKAIDVIEAQEALTLIRAIGHYKTKASYQREREKKLNDMAYPRHIYRRDTRDVSVLVNKLGGKNGRRK